MHKDPNLRKRNALVIPGGLLALLAFVGILYVVGVRSDAGTCEDAGLMVFAGACRSALLVMAIPLTIGIALALTGALAFRSQATCRQGHGSWAHFGLAVLIALVVLPILGALLAPALLGTSDPAISRGGVSYPVTTIMGGLAVVGLIALVPFLSLYVARTRANPCCAEKGCFSPCFCDEPIDAPPAEPAPAEAAVEEQQPAAAAWTESAPAPAAAPAPEGWEVLPDEPAAAPAEGAPPLASRPADPAAPPQDAMARAAKWAEEDAEAEREMAGSDGRARKARAAAAQSKAAKKPAKKSSK